MLRQRRDLAVGLLALALLCALWVPTAGAHPRDLGGEPALPAAVQPLDSAPLSPADVPPANPIPVAETPAPIRPGPAAALLGVLLLGLAAARWPAATVRVLLGVLVVVAVAEGAVHSVHHIDNPQSGANCQVLTITQQLHGEMSPELPSGAHAVEFRPYAVSAVFHDTAQCVRRPDEGRAPPLPLA